MTQTTTAYRRVRHKKRNTTYRVLGLAEVQVSTGNVHLFLNEDGEIEKRKCQIIYDGRQLTVYQDEQSNKLWVRPSDEFEDGRFEDVTTTEPSVTIKPLNWRVGASDVNWVGWGITGPYYITNYRGMELPFKLEGVRAGGSIYFNTLEEAMAIAQADYEKRVREALVNPSDNEVNHD